MGCDEIVRSLFDQLKESEAGRPIQLSKEMIEYLAERDSEAKELFAISRHEDVQYDSEGSHKGTETSEVKYTEPSLLLYEMPEVQRYVSAISDSVREEGAPGYQLCLLPERRVAFFKKESTHLSVSPGVVQGESDIYDTKLTLVRILQF